MHYAMSYTMALCFLLSTFGVLSAFFHLRYISVCIAIILFITVLSSGAGILAHFNPIEEISSFLQLKQNSAKTDFLALIYFASLAIILLLVSQKALFSKRNITRLLVGLGLVFLASATLSLFLHIAHANAIRTSMEHPTRLMQINADVGFFLLSINIMALAASNIIQFQRFIPLLVTVLISLSSLLLWGLLIHRDSFTITSAAVTRSIIAKELSSALLLGLVIYFLQRAKQHTKYINHLLAISKSTLEATVDGILLCNNKGEIIQYNKEFAHIWGLPLQTEKDSLHSLDLKIVFSEAEDASLLLTYIKIWIDNPLPSSALEIKLKDGKILEIGSVPQKINGLIIGRVFSFHDITDRKNVENELFHHATHDVLTGLANRFVLLDHIKQAIYLADRENQETALLFIDLNRFKPINDSLGHVVGDLLLKAVAARLQICTRKEDTLARLGGDEFVLLVVNIAQEDYLAKIIDRYINAFSKPFHVENHELHLSCCIGVSLYPKDGNNAETLLKNADIAMYRAKQNHHHFAFYHARMHDHLSQRVILENDLYRALRNNEFFLCYQPIISIRDKAITSLEVLIRWQHPKRGLISPSEFIPVAEEMGIIHKVDSWTLNMACAQIKRWQKNNIFDSNVSISINVSEEFKHPSLCEEVLSALSQNAVSSANVVLELTESTLMEGDQVQTTIKKLRAAGIKIAVDDFGVSYSSLNHLKRFTIDKLKIDQTFVKNVPHDNVDSAIILAIITLAKTLKLTTLAEGVETFEQFKFLHNNGCDEIQGYYFSHPLTTNQLEQSISELNKKIHLFINSLSSSSKTLTSL